MKYLNITFLSEATSLIDLKGENNTNPFDYLLLARQVAGADPIDLPKIKIF